MEIERVNDTTIKFFVTYKDIEDRGFDRDEIWYNRERGEELFFEMMNEASDRDEFELDGPLWIQVHALDKGLEVVVTRGQVSGGNVRLEIPVIQEDDDDLQEQLNLLADDEESDIIDTSHEQLEIVIGFRSFEDVISLSHNFYINDLFNELYHFEDTYFLHVVFNDDRYDEDEQDDMLSQILEYGFESDLSINRIKEYGKEIVATNALPFIRSSFSK